MNILNNVRYFLKKFFNFLISQLKFWPTVKCCSGVSDVHHRRGKGSQSDSEHWKAIKTITLLEQSPLIYSRQKCLIVRSTL